jgi:hypothetical protein
MKTVNEVIKSVIKEYLIEQQQVSPKPINSIPNANSQEANLMPKPTKCVPSTNEQGQAYDDLGFQLSSLLNGTDRFFRDRNWKQEYIDVITKMYNNTKILYNATVGDPYTSWNKQCYPALHVFAYQFEVKQANARGMNGLLVKKLSELINELKTGTKYENARTLFPDFFIPKLEEILQMFINKIK